MRKTLCIILLFALVVAFTSSVVAQAAAPKTTSSDNGTSTGQRIGNIISAAVSTAFPAVDKILTAIWPRSTDRKTADQAKPVVQAAKDTADQAQKDNLTKLTTAANNLAVARSFVTACGEVNVRIGVMRAMLATKDSSKPLTKEEIQKLQDWWNPASDRLKDLQDQKLKDQVSGLDDDFLKNTFTDVQNAVRDLSGNITNQLTQGRAADLRNSLDQLEPKLAGINPLTAILIGDISSSLTKASNKIAGAAGVEEDQAAAADRNSNLSLMKKLQSFNESK